MPQFAWTKRATGCRSLFMSIGSTRPGSTGLTPIGPVVHWTSAMPSVLPLAIASKAIMPLAPLRFSTTMRWPRRFCTASEKSLATVSPMPPGWKPTTILTGPLSGLNASGSAAWAAAGSAATSSAIAHCLKMFPFPFWERLVVRGRLVEDLEALLELRRDRDVQLLARRQARNEPFLVERQQVVIGRELAEGPLDGRGQFGLAFAEHDAVGIVRQVIADHLHLGFRLVMRDQAVEQDVVGREGVGLAVGQHLVRLLVVVGGHDLEAERGLGIGGLDRLLVGRALGDDDGLALEVGEGVGCRGAGHHQLGTGHEHQRREGEQLA